MGTSSNTLFGKWGVLLGWWVAISMDWESEFV